MHRKVAGLVAAVLALGAASCGGDEPLTKAEFVRQADSICTKARSEARALKPPQLDDKDAVVQFAGKSLDVEKRLLAKLRDIDPPDALRARYDTYLEQVQLNQQLNRQIVQTIASGGGDASQAVDEAAAAERDDSAHAAVTTAKAIGFKRCGV